MEMAYLCPPGNGVFTVNTGREKKDRLHQILYGQTGDQVTSSWKQSLQGLDSRQGSVLLGVSSDCGGGILRGANWGPLFIRNELYSVNKNLDVFDLGDVRVIPHLLMDKYLNEETLERCRKSLYGSSASHLPVGPLSITMDLVEKFYHQFKDKGLIALGGDHSVSFPLTRPFLRRRKSQGRSVAIIHFDAHTDLLKSRLGIDICFGSWAYHILKDLPSPGHLYQIGIRSSAKDEAYWEGNFKVQQFWSLEIKAKGAEAVADDIIADLKRKKVDELYVSFDIDAIDSTYASATGTPEPDGLEPGQAMIILEKLNEQFPITGADMVEVAPFVRHHEDYPTSGPDSTLTIAGNFVRFFIEAVNRAYGKR